MKLLKTVSDKDIFGQKTEGSFTFRHREATRAIVIDDMNRIGILFVSKKNYHKLPGGGMEDGEDQIAALEREVLEELGCRIEINSEVGQVNEYRDEHELFQESYCYIAYVNGKKGSPAFTNSEISGGFKIIWLPISEAIAKLKSDQPKSYEGKFIQQRDLTLLLEAKRLMEKSGDISR